MRLYYQGMVQFTAFLYYKVDFVRCINFANDGGINEATRTLINDHITKKIQTQPCIIARCVF